jgi:Skp family chaperone for outer membrane proteins
MKRGIRALLGGLLLLTVGSWASAQQRAAPAGGTPPTSASAGGIALIDLQYVFENHPRFKQQVEAMKRDVQAFEEMLKSKQQEIETQRKLLGGFKSGSPDHKRIEETTTKQLADMQVQMQLKRKDVMEQEARIYYETYQEVVRAVEAFAERNRISLVLRYERETPSDAAGANDPRVIMKHINRPVIFQRRLDISQLIVGELSRTPVARAPATGRPQR